MGKVSTDTIMRLLNSTTDLQITRMCRKELKRRGYDTLFDNYVRCWILT